MKGGVNRGFTLTELLVCIAIVAVLAGICLPALATASGYTKAMVCMDNAKKLALGWTMYANDHNGVLVENYHGSDTQGGANKNSWAAGWMDWTTRSDNTNESLIIDPGYAKLATYVNKDKRVFKCPADRYLAQVQLLSHFKERVRSVSMNSCMGDGNDKNWYGKSHTIYKKITDLKKLSPMNAWVFADEQADSINGPCLFVNPTATSWVDLPASYHEGAGSFSFADGHAELKKWMDSSTMVPVNISHFNTVTATGGRDWRWVVDRTSEHQ